MLPLLPGDIILVRSDTFFGWLIRLCTRSQGEIPTIINHVGLAVDETHWLDTGNTVVLREFMPRQNVWIASNKRFDEAQRVLVVRQGMSYLGRKYGWLKILAHGLDYFLFKSHYVVRRILFMDNYPICSWLVAHSYNKAVWYTFGVPPGHCTPDDIDDWVRTHPDEWRLRACRHAAPR